MKNEICVEGFNNYFICCDWIRDYIKKKGMGSAHTSW